MFSLMTRRCSSRSSIIKSWFSLSMLTMMDLMDGSHSTSTPRVASRPFSVDSRAPGDQKERTSDCARHVVAVWERLGEAGESCPAARGVVSALRFDTNARAMAGAAPTKLPQTVTSSFLGMAPGDPQRDRREAFKTSSSQYQGFQSILIRFCRVMPSMDQGP